MENTYRKIEKIICWKLTPETAVGYIFDWTGEKPPAGWLICNGQIVPQAKYPLLYKVIGDAYNRTYFKRNYNRRRFQFWKPKYIPVTEDITGYFRLPDFTVRSYGNG